MFTTTIQLKRFRTQQKMSMSVLSKPGSLSPSNQPNHLRVKECALDNRVARLLDSHLDIK